MPKNPVIGILICLALLCFCLWAVGELDAPRAEPANSEFRNKRVNCEENAFTLEQQKNCESLYPIKGWDY